jgi:transposase
VQELRPVNVLDPKLTPAERRLRVALGVRLGKSNRAIAKELGVDEGTVRRDRKFLATPQHLRPTKKERPKKPKKVKEVIPAYNLDDAASVELHFRRVSKVLKLWTVEERMVLNEIEYVLHEAGKRLFVGRASIEYLLVPTQSPAELLPVARPNGAVWGDFIPNPDFWADWLARWIALCLPRQHELHQRLLKETSLWARSQ